MMQPHFVVNTG